MARAVVVGGGFGGLAAALRLAKLGHAVTLVEQSELGGALAPVARDAFAWDTATHTLVPGVVRDLFRKTGRPLERELDLVQLDCLREHWFEDGTSLVLTARRSEQLAAFDRLRPGLGRGLRRPRGVVRRPVGGAAARVRRGALGPRPPAAAAGRAARVARVAGRRLRRVSRDERLGRSPATPFTAAVTTCATCPRGPG